MKPFKSFIEQIEAAQAINEKWAVVRTKNGTYNPDTGIVSHHPSYEKAQEFIRKRPGERDVAE